MIFYNEITQRAMFGILSRKVKIMHYDDEWEKYHGQYDKTQEANAARENMILKLSVDEKINIMFDSFLRTKENYQVIELAKRYCEKE